MDESQHLLKTGSPGCGDLKNDVTSSKPCSKGRDVADDSQAVLVLCVVVVRDEAPFPDLKAGHVDHLLSYTKGLYIFLGLYFEDILRLCSKWCFFLR